jgi:preprotein translocase subunit SecG
MVPLLDSNSSQRILSSANTSLINRYTFWVAVLVLVLTIFFGLVQSIEGALQVYASFKDIH